MYFSGPRSVRFHFNSSSKQLGPVGSRIAQIASVRQVPQVLQFGSLLDSLLSICKLLLESWDDSMTIMKNIQRVS